MLYEERLQVEAHARKTLREVCDDADYLEQLHVDSREDRERTRALINGGPEGLTALLGNNFKTQEPPVLNILDSALNRLSAMLGAVPELTAPRHTQVDSEAARKAAEKRERIVRGYDEAARLELAMEQAAMWLPGYGFVPWVMVDKVNPNGDAYPVAELRDPYDCYPSEWGVQQQPSRCMFLRRIPRDKLLKLYPMAAQVLSRSDMGGGAGGVDLTAHGHWEGNDSRSVEVVEYWDKAGTWTVLRDQEFLLDFWPNPLKSGPAFRLWKRFSFDKLKGHYHHVIGLMAAIAKMNLLTEIAMTDAVFAETNVHGTLARGNRYEKGRNAINWFDAGTRVEKPSTTLPPQVWQQIDRLERQFRIGANYPVTQDAESPNSFVTGRGMDELQGAVGKEAERYRKVIVWGTQDLDGMRLEWDEASYPNRRKPIFAHEFSDGEEYVPTTHIKGRYQTKRKYGLLSGLDDANKIVGMLQLRSADGMSQHTFIENVPGVVDAAEELKRLEHEKAREVLHETLLALAGQGDPRAVLTLIDTLPPSELRDKFEKFYSPEGEEPTEAQAGMIEPQPQMEDAASVLSRLSMGGDVSGGSQVIGAL